MIKPKVRIKVEKCALYCLIGIVALIMFLPFYWLIVSSLKPMAKLFEPEIIPSSISLRGYAHITSSVLFRRGFLNSCIVSGSATLLSLMLAILAGYGFSRFRFPGHGFLLMFFLWNRMIPAILLSLGYFIMVAKLRLYDSLFALILMDTAIPLPFALWMMKNYFDTVPVELDDAAMIDGCSRLGVLCRVVLPVSRPGVAAAAVYCFLMVWQEFLYAFTFTSSEANRLVPVVIYSFLGEYVTNYEEMFAASVIFVLPLMVAFVVAQRQLIKGLTAGFGK